MGVNTFRFSLTIHTKKNESNKLDNVAYCLVFIQIQYHCLAVTHWNMHASPSSPFTHLSRWEGFTFIATIKHSNAIPFTQGHESLEEKEEKKEQKRFCYRAKRRERKWKKKHFQASKSSSDRGCIAIHIDVMWHNTVQTVGELRADRTVCSQFRTCTEILLAGMRPYHWRGSRGGEMKDRCNHR